MCVCVSTPHHACTQLPANSERADLETRACACPGNHPTPSPELHRNITLVMLIITPPLTISKGKQLNAPHDAISSTHVTDVEYLIYPRGVHGFFLFSRIVFLPSPEPPTQ